MNAKALTPEDLPGDLTEILAAAMVTAGLEWPLQANGNLEVLSRPRIAFAGTRLSSPTANDSIQTLACALAREGVCIVSGGAVGTDMAAHCGALRCGGATVFVLPEPLENIELATWRSTLPPFANGEDVLFLSPFSRQSKQSGSNPLIRNRLIVGLAQATVAGETRLRSGTNHFLQLSRERQLPLWMLDSGPSDPVLREALRTLERGGARLFSYAQSREPELAKKIIESARQFALEEMRRENAQLRFFEEPEEYRSQF